MGCKCSSYVAHTVVVTSIIGGRIVLMQLLEYHNWDTRPHKCYGYCLSITEKIRKSGLDRYAQFSPTNTKHEDEKQDVISFQ